MKALGQVDEKGFTLIEALLVLSVVIIISSISLLQLRPLHESKKIDHFLEQLQNDIFYAQQYAISHSETTQLYFNASQSYYRVNTGISNEVVLFRKIDTSITVQYTTLGTTLVFTKSGNIQRAGEIRFRSKGDTYKVTFQIGKGRFYVQKM
ncbi:competence type IV pilus minor pilin ComGD [Ferdinandcohnia sp. Marseille-Q9671]